MVLSFKNKFRFLQLPKKIVEIYTFPNIHVLPKKIVEIYTFPNIHVHAYRYTVYPPVNFHIAKININ